MMTKKQVIKYLKISFQSFRAHMVHGKFDPQAALTTKKEDYKKRAALKKALDRIESCKNCERERKGRYRTD